jgi:hypothetical protein
VKFHREFKLQGARRALRAHLDCVQQLRRCSGSRNPEEERNTTTLIWATRFDLGCWICSEKTNPSLPKVLKHQSPEAPKKYHSRVHQFDIRGKLKCVEGETSEAQSSRAPSPEAPDKHLSAKHLVIAHGHMRFWPK